MSARRPLILVSLLAALLLGGCLAVGGGITERQWNAALEALEPGLTQQQVTRMLGEPREKNASEPGADHDSVWIYSRPEVTGTRTVLTAEHDILLPNGKNTQTVPDYEDRDVRVIAEYHLRWTGETLTTWERIVDR